MALSANFHTYFTLNKSQVWLSVVEGGCMSFKWDTGADAGLGETPEPEGTSDACLSLLHFVKCEITSFTPTAGIFLVCGLFFKWRGKCSVLGTAAVQRPQLGQAPLLLHPDLETSHNFPRARVGVRSPARWPAVSTTGFCYSVLTCKMSYLNSVVSWALWLWSWVA